MTIPCVFCAVQARAQNTPVRSPQAAAARISGLVRTRAPANTTAEGEKRPFTITGRLDAISDGVLIVSNPISLEERQKFSNARQIPLSQVPRRGRAEVLLRLHGQTLREIRQMLGQEVEVKATVDRSGAILLSEISLQTRIGSR